MNFRDLAQRVAQESGIVGALGNPASVVGQTGTLGKIVTWTGRAWTGIQEARRDWLWMRREFEGVTFSGIARYAPSSLGATRHAEFRVNDKLTAQPPATTAAEEREMTRREWDWFREYRLRGASRETTGAPREWTVAPTGEVVLWPMPDAAYTIRGEHQVAPQTLLADDDVPEMPEKHHDLIWITALISLGTDEEALQQLPLWERERVARFNGLVLTQTPRIDFRAGGPLA